MKILSKTHIVREKKMDYVKLERDVMTKLNHPNIVRLLLTFQDPGNLYYVVELAQNGDMQSILNEYYALPQDIAKHILGQTLLAIAHMHQRRIIHRDLKPENVLIDSKNRVKITDFGTAKLFPADGPFICDHGSFVGSAEYVCPETLQETPLGSPSDLWSFGCMVYSLLAGEPPFRSNSDYQTFQLIKTCKFTVPDFFSPEARDLVEKLLVHNPNDRLGANDYSTNYKSIREHPFFAGINWGTLPMEGLEGFKSSPEAIAWRDKKLEEEKSNSPDFFGETVVKEANAVNQEEDVCLLLTDKPRLFVTDIEKTSIKFEIDIDDAKVTKLNDSLISIATSSAEYMFTLDEADSWIEAINDCHCD